MVVMYLEIFAFVIRRIVGASPCVLGIVLEDFYFDNVAYVAFG